MSMLDDLAKVIAGRVWMAFFGVGHTMVARICADEHLLINTGGRRTPATTHLDVELRLWNKGGRAVSFIAWQAKTKRTYTADLYPGEARVLEQDGRPITLNWLIRPKDDGIEFETGDTFTMIIHLSNGVKKKFSTKVE